ncbi:hypothetical protein [Cellulosimicrobium marinum]|uniref:hypothetical protein n=1 Tax=Cellulosimicrobium marinum TaxID=1638992 RepID=UPI001E41D1F9|nr:hypothetical protein [Cellulosimicrobium marinum]MCB7135850.1 hypothetical protein [Cellulosimicrobium marinum]
MADDPTNLPGPDRWLDRGRAVRARVETSARDVARRLLAPGGPLGPQAPPSGVPARVSDRPSLRKDEVLSALPVGVELGLTPARGDVDALGWAGEVFTADGPHRPLLHRLPERPATRSEKAWGLVDLVLSDVHGGHVEPRGVELVAPDGRMLLRITDEPAGVRPTGPQRRVELPDGVPVATFGFRRVAGRRVVEVLPVGAHHDAPLTCHKVTDHASGWTVIRQVRRGDTVLAELLRDATTRRLRVDRVDRDDLPLVWAGLLWWWGAEI